MTISSHTTRMVGPEKEQAVKSKPVDSKPVESKPALKEKIKEVVKEVDQEISERAEALTEEADKKEQDMKEELLTDIDFDGFFFTGEIEYTFKLSKKASVVMRVLSSSELQETQAFLWKLRNEDMSAIEAETKYAVEVVSRALVKYVKTDLSKKSLEEKRDFINALPSMMVPLLFRKYGLLEKSANEALSKEDFLKN